jgi:hypothetical protein
MVGPTVVMMAWTSVEWKVGWLAWQRAVKTASPRAVQKDHNSAGSLVEKRETGTVELRVVLMVDGWAQRMVDPKAEMMMTFGRVKSGGLDEEMLAQLKMFGY